jgi:type 1 fimbria pilin
MKKSFPLLRAIGLSAGLVASAATMAPVHAAACGTLRVSGTVPVACSVEGVDVNMGVVRPAGGGSYLSGGNSVGYVAAVNTTIAISIPVLTLQPDGSSVFATISATHGGDSAVAKSSGAPLGAIAGSMVKSGGTEGQIELSATIESTSGRSSSLAPGSYEATSTITCVSN